MMLLWFAVVDMVFLAARMFDEFPGEFGFTLSMSLRQSCWSLGMVQLAPLKLDEGVMEVVDKFKHLGSLVEACR